jgi:hypothetical protein
MLDELPGRSSGQERLAFSLPRGRDRVTAGNSLGIAALGLLEKSPLTKMAKRLLHALT